MASKPAIAGVEASTTAAKPQMTEPPKPPVSVKKVADPPIPMSKGFFS